MLNLADDAYWTDPWQTRKAVQRSLMQSGDEGFLIGAPSAVPLDRRDRFPVAVLYARKLNGGRGVNFRASAIITAMDLHTHALHAAPAFGSRNRTSSPTAAGGASAKKAPADSFSNDDTAMVCEGHTIDLAKRLNIPHQRGEYIVHLVCLDQVSNGCPMKLVESAVYQDPAVDAYIAEQLESQPTPTRPVPTPGTPVPCYDARDNSPKIPAAAGIAMDIDRVTPIDEATSCIVRGSYRLPVRPQHILDHDDDSPSQAVGDYSSWTAMVPITLLLTGTVNAAPVTISLLVPTSHDLVPAGDGVHVTGHFAVDLCRLADLASTPQTYFVYAFSGPVMSGPTPAAFVEMPVLKRSR